MVLFSTVSLFTQSQIGPDIIGEHPGDRSGRAVSLSADGLRIATGARSNSDAADGAGQVRVHEFNGTNWVQVGTDIEGHEFMELMGQTVALSADGNRVAMGSGTSATDGERGLIRIYEYDGSHWNQLGSDIKGEEENDEVGQALAISNDGNRIAYASDVNLDIPGELIIREYNGSDWEILGSKIPSLGPFQSFGKRGLSLSGDGNTVAGSGSMGGSNYVRAFEFNGSAWIQKGANAVGTEVSLSEDGNRMAVSTATTVQIYEFDGMNWIQVGTDIAAAVNNSSSGDPMVLSRDGTTIAIGTAGTGMSGQIEVYQFSGSDWQLIGCEVTGFSGEHIGQDIAISDDGTRVATNGNINIGAGTARVYCIKDRVPAEIYAIYSFIEYGGIPKAIIQIEGTLNSATEWALYRGNCGRFPIATSRTGSFIIFGGVGGEYFIRGEGDCLDEVASCESIYVQGIEIDPSPFLFCPQYFLIDKYIGEEIYIPDFTEYLLDPEFLDQFQDDITNPVDESGIEFLQFPAPGTMPEPGMLIQVAVVSNNTVFGYCSFPAFEGYNPMGLSNSSEGYSGNGASFLDQQNIQESEQIKLYPNPAKDYIEVSFNTLAKDQVQLEVINAHGAIKIKQYFDAVEGFNQKTIDISHLTPGLYYIRLRENQKQTVQKFIRS